MTFIADRTGNIKRSDSSQERLLSFLYGNVIGRVFLRPLVSPWFSRIGGKLLNSRVSALGIPAFVKANKIDMSIYEQKKYQSYNAFFSRRMIDGKRKVEKDPHILISPCDGRLSVYPVTEKGIVHVKNTPYTVSSLLRDEKLAEKYKGGWVWIFRLCVEDYHRYVYPDHGEKTENVKIPGIFHTVHPIANEIYPIYKENTREYTILHSENFGDILIMEVGALLVGKIENRHGKAKVRRGQEKGNFAFGGSTILFLTEEGRVVPDEEIQRYSSEKIETRVLLGEHVGHSI